MTIELILSILKKNLLFGNLIFFLYDPKHKATLPYYDKFPLVIPFNVDDKSFIGLNLHYLPPRLRKQLVEFLIGNISTKSMKDYIKISYQAIISSSKSDLVKPCIHRYLFSHVQSKFVSVNYNEWMNVVPLPVAQFMKGIPY